MRNLNLLAAAAATLLVGGVAIAADSKPANAPKQEKKICKGDSDSTSRIAKNRVCRTKAEWRDMSGREGIDTSLNRLRAINRGN